MKRERAFLPFPSVDAGGAVATVAQFAPGWIQEARSHGPALQPAGPYPPMQYLDVPDRYNDASPSPTRALSTASRRHEMGRSEVSHADSRMASTRYETGTQKSSCASLKVASTRYETGVQALRRTEAKSLAPRRTTSKAPASSRHETGTSVSKAQRAETGRTETKPMTSRSKDTEKQATEYTNIYLSRLGRSTPRN